MPPVKVEVAVDVACILPKTPRVAVRLPKKKPFPTTDKALVGEVVPMPKLPFPKKLSRTVVLPDNVVVAIVKRELVAVMPRVLFKVKREPGVDVPIPNRLFTLSQNRFALFWLSEPLAAKNGMEPVVKLESVVEANVGAEPVPMACGVAMVMEPLPLVIFISFVVPVNVPSASVLPVVFPMSNWPFV